jgi:hypothetical protein
MREAVLTVVLSLALGMGTASAVAEPNNAGATWTYLRAEYSLTRTLYANLSLSGRTVGGMVGHIDRECPRVLAGAPDGQDLDRLREEVALAVLYTALAPDSRPALDVARTVSRLRWTDRRLTRIVRDEARHDRMQAHLLMAIPSVCTDTKAWVAGGYRTLPAGTARFLKAAEAQSTGPEVEPLPLLARYEGPRARLLVRRIRRLRAAFAPRFPVERWVTLAATAIGAIAPNQPVTVRTNGGNRRPSRRAVAARGGQVSTPARRDSAPSMHG